MAAAAFSIATCSCSKAEAALADSNLGCIAIASFTCEAAAETDSDTVKDCERARLSVGGSSGPHRDMPVGCLAFAFGGSANESFALAEGRLLAAGAGERNKEAVAEEVAVAALATGNFLSGNAMANIFSRKSRWASARWESDASTPVASGPRLLPGTPVLLLSFVRADGETTIG